MSRAGGVTLLGWAAIVAPALHTLTDVVEWAQGGFAGAGAPADLGDLRNGGLIGMGVSLLRRPAPEGISA